MNQFIQETKTSNEILSNFKSKSKTEVENIEYNFQTIKDEYWPKSNHRQNNISNMNNNADTQYIIDNLSLIKLILPSELHILQTSFNESFSEKYPNRLLNWVSSKLHIHVNINKPIQIKANLLEGLILLQFTKNKQIATLQDLYKRVGGDTSEFVNALLKLVKFLIKCELLD